MIIHNLYSSCVIIEDKDTRILCDPWLSGSSHYGSWAIYPPYNFDPTIKIDYIYISHIHQDHLHRDTLSQLPKDIPIIIHNFIDKFVKNNLTSLGFKVIELENNTRTQFGDIHINIISADNCNPEMCGKFLGCASVEPNYKATQIDTMAFFDNEDEVILNTNDCPYELIQLFLPDILKQYNNIDMMLVGYTGAGPYPQSFIMPDEDKLKAIKSKKQHFLDNAVKLLELVKPTYYMPFAGAYVLAGKFHVRNRWRSEADIDEAVEYLNYIPGLIMLNSDEYFDISTGQQSAPYTPIDHNKRRAYIKNTLSKVKYDYENYIIPSDDEIIELAKIAHDRFVRYLDKINYSTDTAILIEFNDRVMRLTRDIVFEDKEDKKYLRISLDSRLLKRILLGPKYAHWQVADGGSHLTYERQPKNNFERGLLYALCYFHV